MNRDIILKQTMQTAAQINSNRARVSAPGGPLYTHQLPYGVRQHICNLLDADQSWRLLGGQFMQLDATQLRLIGQALLRNDSPTGELLNKLDAANMQACQLLDYLSQMGHSRATEILRPHVIASNQGQGAHGTLDTPTPSFDSIEPVAIMNSSEFNMIASSDYQNQSPSEWRFVESDQSGRLESPAKKCHNTGASSGRNLIDLNELNVARRANEPAQAQPREARDPADEIVRTACANQRKRTSLSDEEAVNQLRLIMQISYSELKQASNDFADSNILGNGGFASVYRGYWKGTDVAIKRLRCNLMDQALNELIILNKYRIDNILPIYGISIDGPEACLVYQFMANGSLEDRLSCKNGTPPLTWDQRAMIAEGVAKGLNFLHTLRDKSPLVHGDAKSANVLLDRQFMPKLGDFGLARQVFQGKRPQTEQRTHCTVSSIHGTSVYLPPEYLRHKILSPAVDVYSYGIVLLEMATGKRAYDGKRLLIDFVEDELKTAATIGEQQQQQQQQQQSHTQPSQEYRITLRDHRVVDSSTLGAKICFELLLQLGVNCAHRIKKKRPHMQQVLDFFDHFRHRSLSTPANKSPSLPPLQIDTNLFMSAATAPASSATTRTLTPDLSANHELNGAEIRLTKPQANQAPFWHNEDSSKLMSVEEEFQLLQQEGELNGQNYRAHREQQPLRGDEQHGTQANQVEAMIPLLTELGFSPQLDNQHCNGGGQ